MPHRNHWLDHGFHCVFDGDVELTEMFQGVDEFWNDARSDRCHYIIVDFGDARLPEIPNLDNAKFVALDKGGSAYKPNFKQAFVARGDYNLAFAEDHVERLQKVGVPWKFGVFETLEEAQAWVEG